MRLHKCQWLLAAGLVAGGCVVYQSRSELRQWFRRHQFRVEGFEQALPSEVYFLETNRWLEFDIPKDAPLARLISNASISSAETVVTGAQWPYAIEYQLRGAQGRTNAAGVYHFKGEHLDFLDRQSGKPVEVSAYLDRRFTPLSARNWMLNLKDPAITNARSLRLRLHSRHPELLEVGIRVYYRTQVPDRKIGYMWNRLSDDQKQDLARGNVYSFQGLNEREKSCLLRYHWAVASPEGIPGRDFDRRVLYVRDDSEGLQLLNDWVPAGIAVDADHCGVLPITNAPGNCQLQMVDFASAAAPQVVSNLLLWHGQLERRIETNQLVWSGTNQILLSSNREGLLHISSSRPIYARTFQVAPGQTNEITPQPAHLLAFTASPTNSVAYAVDHVGDEPTLFRLEVRRFVPSADRAAMAAGRVQYALLAQDGSTVQAEDVTLTNTFSPYDWLVTTNGLTNITVAQSLCFVLPAGIRTLRVTSPRDTVLVNAYSRPSQLVKKIRVPEDYSPAKALAPEQPSWFTVRPPDHLERREAGQASIVRVQPRLPDYDPLVLAGQYEWESFLPEPEARGQMILLPATDAQPPRPENLPFSYYPVAVGCKQQVRFRGQPWENQVEPTLALVFTNGSTGAVSIAVDGQTIFDNRAEAPVMEVRLGRLKTGEHELNISATKPVAAYLNYLEVNTNAAYLQRFCVKASSNVLSFPYVKRQSSPEALVLRVFSPLAPPPEPFAVHLKLKTAIPRALGPFAELTFLEREARVTPGQAGLTRLVAAAPSQLDDGQLLFFPMGPDLPPGRYDLEVQIAAAAPRWLSLSRTTPGLAEKLSFSSQLRVY